MPLQYVGPMGTVVLSTTCYHILFRTLAASNTSTSHRIALNKAISAGHATITTLLALYAVISTSRRRHETHDDETKKISHISGWLDDLRNPLIQDRDDLSSALTAWEAGYLIYDMLALISLEARSPSSSIAKATRKTIQKTPVFMAHHILLASGLLYLQTYIARRKDKGIRIIVAFILMNASTPLMHARWWARKNGKPTRALDLAFAALFAISRFGPIICVMREYGKYHSMTALEAWKWLRTSCRAGMLGLFGMNAAWWTLLVKGLIVRNLKGQEKNG